jgi:peroxiredoxin
MAQLRQDIERFKKLNTVVIAVGPEDHRAFAEWWHKENMPFTGIPDPEHRIADLYGQQVKFMKLGRLPAQFVIDRAGLIRFKHLGSSMKDIPTNDEVLSILEKLQ